MFLSCGQSHGAQSRSVIYLYFINARVDYLVRGLMENNLIMWLNLTSPMQSQNLVTHFLLVWRKPKKTSFVNIKILSIHGDVLTV